MVPGKGTLWFCSLGFNPDPPQSPGANHCLPLSATGSTHTKKRELFLLFKGISEHRLCGRYCSMGRVVVRFRSKVDFYRY
ncbi:rCG55861, partial [Rattus norvegicus]